MASFSIGEVERLLGLPASTIRHWERVVAILDSRKDLFGRRSYTEAEIRLLLRFKHFTYTRGLGLKAAELALVAELSIGRPELRARIAEIRGDLIGLWAQGRSALRQLEGSPAYRSRPPGA